MTTTKQRRASTADALTTTTTTTTPSDQPPPPPTDRYNIIFLIMLVHGVATLTPWNMFITAKSYFDYKMGTDYTGVKTDYNQNFLAYLGFAAQLPNTMFGWLNIFVDIGGDLTPRIAWSIVVEVSVFVATVAMAMVDSSGWPGGFFWATMTMVVILNFAVGILQNSVYGMAAKLPGKYTAAVALGANTGGAFTAIVSTLSTQFFASQRTAAIYYFITAMLVLMLCFNMYFALPLNIFYRYNEMLSAVAQQRERKLSQGQKKVRPPLWAIFKQAWPQLFNVFFTYFVSLSIFPSMHSDISSADPAFFISDRVLYVNVLCFLTFNVFAMCGSATAAKVQWPRKEHLMWPVVARVAFIPLFMLCNYHPVDTVRIMPIYIWSDWTFWALGVAMSFTSGYFSSLSMQYVPRMVAKQHESVAGMFGAAMLCTGILMGVLCSLLFPIMVRSITW